MHALISYNLVIHCLSNGAAFVYAGTMEVLHSKLGLQLDLISRNDEEMQLVSLEVDRAVETVARQLLRTESKLQVYP